MRIAVISDIHANLEALSAVLTRIEDLEVDATYCLGDIVGYGADPKPCLDLVRQSCTAFVRGNHDDAVGFARNDAPLPKDGRIAANHHQKILTEDDLEFLRSLPLRIDIGTLTFCHASPEAPELWQRLDSYFAAKSQFEHFDTDICFVGHTHVPAVLSESIGVLHVRRGHRFLINVGSVGQPRDHDPRAGFGIFDLDKYHYQLIRVPYDVDKAADKIMHAGLPRRLAKRLYRGE